jgi:hypothetical protein
MEAMTPGELYRKSIAGKPIEGKLLARDVADEMAKMGYKGKLIIYQNRGGWSDIYAQLDDVPRDVPADKIAKDFHTAFGTYDRILSGGPVDVRIPLSHEINYVRVFAKTWAWPGAYAGNMVLNIAEAMDPKTLYLKSIKGTHVEGRVKLGEIAHHLARHGLQGNIEIEPMFAGRNHVFAVLPSTYSDMPSKEIEDIFKVVFAANGWPLQGGVRVMFRQNSDVYVHSDIRGFPGAEGERSMKAIIEPVTEAMDPKTLYQKSIEGTPLYSQIIIREMADDLRARGHKVYLINIAPSGLIGVVTLLSVYIKEVPIHGDHRAIALDVQAAARKVITPRCHTRTSQFYPPSHLARGTGTLIVTIVVPVKNISVARYHINEAMEPGELYQRSLKGTHVGARVEFQAIADGFAALGYAGRLAADRPIAGSTTTSLALYLDTGDKQPTDQQKLQLSSDIDKVLKAAGVQKNTSISSAITRVSAYSYIGQAGTTEWTMMCYIYAYAKGALKHDAVVFPIGKVQEAMEPGELYRKSLRGTKAESQILANNVIAYLKSKGCTSGEIEVSHEAGQRTASSLAVIVNDVDASNTVESNEARKQIIVGVKDVIVQSGYPKVTLTLSQLFPSTDNPSLGRQFITYHLPGAPMKPYIGSFSEAMEPGELYKKSLQGSPIESKILAQEIGEYIKAQGYAHYRINLNPASQHTAANMVIYVSGVTNAHTNEGNTKRSSLTKGIVKAVHKAGHPDSSFVSSQLFVNQDNPQVACLAIGIYIPLVRFKEYTLVEGMDPKALYQQSLQGDTAIRIQLRDLAQALAQQGLKGYLAVEPDKFVSPGPSVCALQFRIYGNDVMPTEQEAVELKKVLYDTTKAQGIETEGAIWYGATGATGGAYIRHLNMSFYTVSARMKGIPTVKHMAQIGDTTGQQGYRPNPV